MKLPTLDQLKQAHVLIVGDVMLDRYWYGAVDRISPEAPVPVVRVTREEERLGGCANVAFNVVTLGAQASLLSVLGDDDNGLRLSRLVEKSGIQAHWGRDAQLQTTVKLRIIGRQQQLLRADFENEPQSEVLASQSALFLKVPGWTGVPCALRRTLPPSSGLFRKAGQDHPPQPACRIRDRIHRPQAAASPILPRDS